MRRSKKRALLTLAAFLFVVGCGTEVSPNLGGGSNIVVFLPDPFSGKAYYKKAVPPPEGTVFYELQCFTN